MKQCGALAAHRSVNGSKGEWSCRWEKFAQEKGIKKRKRSVKVWDEDQQEWRRRFGYQRAGDDNDIPIIAAGSNDQAGFLRLLHVTKGGFKPGGRRMLRCSGELAFLS